MANLVAKAEIDIAASAAQVWEALTDPEMIAKYFFGTRVETDWQPGSPIVWKGEYQGKAYEDRGDVVEVEPNQRLTVTHFSPMTGLPDEPENYHTITYEIDNLGDTTRLSLSQDNNKDEAEVEHATENWSVMLSGLKKTVEERRST
jgi:uncharacterized protein YndB with AHSA1/START domain